MILTARNDFHKAAYDLSPVRVYRAGSGQPVAVVSAGEHARIRQALCGMADCACGGFSDCATDEFGTVYAVEVPSRGRPPVADPLARQIQFRVTDDERATITEAAAREGRTLSGYVRVACLDRACDDSPSPE